MSKEQDTTPREGNRKSQNQIFYPYEVDYNDHFETPITAYEDILPILDAIIAQKIAQTTICQHTCRRSTLKVYDPFYCNGQSKIHLQKLGFESVIHEKRDFYKDVREKACPDHQVFVTNPPYSGNHKERVLEFAAHSNDLNNARCTPFLLLMPNYVATKEYCRAIMDGRDASKQNDKLQFLYIVPGQPYEYEHPEQTGKDVPPFFSIWFCGLPIDLDVACISWDGIDSICRPRLAKSVRELEEWQAVPTQKRLNPKQRKKLKMKRSDIASEIIKSSSHDNAGSRKNGGTLGKPVNCGKGRNDIRTDAVARGKADTKKVDRKKKSIHRDSNGVRKKRRF